MITATPKKKECVEVAADQTMSAETLISRAIDQNVPVETMEKLLAMRRELKAEFAKEQFDIAMALFQKECPVINKSEAVKNKDKISVRYKYAPLDIIVSQVKDIMSKNGFSHTEDAIVEDKWVIAVCKVKHIAGHSETSQFKIPIDTESYMTQPQRFAAALTFGKRYAFCNAFGILTGDEDNDANIPEDKPAVKTPFETAKEMIKNIKIDDGGAGLLEIRAKVQASEKYNDAQRQEILDLIDSRLK
jgi:hypothetical protein